MSILGIFNYLLNDLSYVTLLLIDSAIYNPYIKGYLLGVTKLNYLLSVVIYLF